MTTPPLTVRLASDLDAAFPEMIDVYGSMVLTLAGRLTDDIAAQDITQEVFLRAFRALRGYTPDRIGALDVRPWLATITRNLVRNEYRRRDRKPTSPLRAGDSVVADASDLVIDGIDAHDRVAGLLSVLSEPQREAVVLRHVIGLPMREVAATMACPEGTAKSHVSRGLDRLRNKLEGDNK